MIITEHYPSPSAKIIPNKDKPHGPDTRIPDNSGVYLDLPPFNLKDIKLVMNNKFYEFNSKDGESLKSYLLQN